MITHSDEGPDPDDELAVLLRPPAEFLGAPPGHYEAIRRGASRRKALRAAVGAAATCAVAALVVLPLRLTSSDGPTTPTIPMAPPSATTPAPDRSATPVPSAVPSKAPGPDDSTPTSRPLLPSATPSDMSSNQAPAVEPSTVRTEEGAPGER
ncbi:hypothetical protein ABZ896_33945 [Streptomyces sp. NPDC047072]|uniref:hypothetical protein n=1 Tax=Streptomyces sp. NPDC047072 TaxID=3154809 RepID=UPI0033E89EB2